MDLVVGVDIGGTFTDVVAVEVSSGKIVSTKVVSTPEEFSRGFFNAVDKVLNMCGASPGDIRRLVHGTTVATNSIVEYKGDKIGILTTRGFRDQLIIGREWRTDLWSVQFDPQTPTFLCDRERIREIGERLDYQGNVLTPLNENDVIKEVDYLVQKHGARAIAVCYLFSFLNPTHEQRTEQIIQERYPNIRVSLSSKLNPRIREYERLVITAFNSYVSSTMEKYIVKLQEGLRDRHIQVALQVMQSRGGITSAAMCIERPVVTLLSGPAGGLISSNFIAGLRHKEDVVTLDMGGTSNDTAVIVHGKPRLSLEGMIGNYPCRQTMLDISTIGAGGGSIAWVDPAGQLKVGPQSAGANPGPACYGWGGQEATVTDASVILGYLNPEYFGAGELRLNLEFARKTIDKRVATPLGMDVVKAATGIHRIVNNNMADQVRRILLYRGFDPRQFVLIAFGGAGPVAAGRLTQLLGFKEVIIPPAPGVLAALGLLLANIEHEEIITLPIRAADEVDPKDIERAFRRSEKLCEQKREGIGMSKARLHISHSAEMRYVGQSHELEVPFPEVKGEMTRDVIQEAARRFHDVHQSTYQHSRPNNPVEFVAFRTAFSQRPDVVPTFRKLNPSAETTPKGWRHAYFDEYQDYVNTPLYERLALALRQRINGPAIVEQEDSTTVIYPNQQAEVDEWGNLVLRVT